MKIWGWRCSRYLCSHGFLLCEKFQCLKLSDRIVHFKKIFFEFSWNAQFCLTLLNMSSYSNDMAFKINLVKRRKGCIRIQGLFLCLYCLFSTGYINITYQVFNFVCSAGRYLFNVENKAKGMSPNLVFNMNRIQANWSSFIPHEIVRKPRLNPFIIRSEI